MPKKIKKTYLITGGTGFIGRNIAENLIKNGFKVVIFDNNFRGALKKLKSKKKVKFIKGDIRNRNLFFKSLKDINAVIHLAYINGTKNFYSNPNLVLDVAIKGLLNVLDGCVKYRINELHQAQRSTRHH